MEQQYSDYFPLVAALVVLSLLYFGRGAVAGSAIWVKLHSPRQIKPFYKQVLQSYFKYYQELSLEDKQRFELRVQSFIDSNEFIPRGFSTVSDEMKTLIAGAAIQLSFGFKHLNFTHFSKILIYPDHYYSHITRQRHEGEVNPKGLIVLSWKAFEKGYKDSSDGRNLALHEMAHALRLENSIYNREYEFISFEDLRQFDALAHEEIQRIKKGEKSFFRSYGATNIHEFFAVAVENFFERPRFFLEEKPAIYMALSKLLKQDPVQLFQRKAS